MNKSRKNKPKKQIAPKVALGTMAAAGITAMSMNVAAGNAASTPAGGEDVELTAADAVVIDGDQVKFDDLLAQTQNKRRDVAETMYGPRRPIRLMYGPRPRPRLEIETPEVVDTVVTKKGTAPLFDKSDVLVRVTATVAEIFNIGTNEVIPETNFITDLGGDSLDLINTVIAIEKEFDIYIPNERLETMYTVGDVVEYISSL